MRKCAHGECETPFTMHANTQTFNFGVGPTELAQQRYAGTSNEDGTVYTGTQRGSTKYENQGTAYLFILNNPYYFTPYKADESESK